MEDCSLEIKGEVQQIYKVLSKDDQDKMPFEGIQIAKTLSRVPFFRRFFDINSEFFINLCIAQAVVEYQKGTAIYEVEEKEGSQRYLYVILEGIVTASSKHSNNRTMGLLKIFGQLQIVFELGTREEETICQTNCKFMKISENSLMKLLINKDGLKKCLHFLDVNPYFHNLNKLEKMQLSLTLTKKNFEKNEILKIENEPMENIMFFIYGKVQVIAKFKIEKEQDYVIDQLTQMSTFGEYQCVTGNNTDLKMRGSLSGGYYIMNYAQIVAEQHKIVEILEKNACPYPNTENLIFLHNVKETLKKQEKRVSKFLI